MTDRNSIAVPTIADPDDKVRAAFAPAFEEIDRIVIIPTPLSTLEENERRLKREAEKMLKGVMARLGLEVGEQ